MDMIGEFLLENLDVEIQRKALEGKCHRGMRVVI